ncbi:MAG: glycosyltransferase [Bacteroidota bacterium]
MKIMMLIDSLVRGGRERRLLELLKAFSQREGIQTVLVLFSRRVEYEEIKQMDLPIYYLDRKPAKDPRVFYRLWQLCKKERPDVLHCWGWMPAVYAVPTALHLNIPLLNASISDAPHDLHWGDPRYFRARITFPFSKAIVGNSKAGLNVYDAPKSKSYCIYNGFDFQRIKHLEAPDCIRKKLNIQSKYIVGMVGAFYKRKDYVTFLRAAQEVLEQGTDVTFLAIGDGPTLEQMKNKVPPAYKDRILFTGLMSNVESIVNCFDIGVLTTYTEGISNAIMEYMVLGKAVITTGSGGIREIVQDGHTGYALPSGSWLQLADYIIQLLEDDQLRQAIGQRGKALIYEQFSLDRMEKEYLDLYGLLTNGKIPIFA